MTRAERFALPRSGDGADLRGGQARKNIAAMAVISTSHTMTGPWILGSNISAAA